MNARVGGDRIELSPPGRAALQGWPVGTDSRPLQTYSLSGVSPVPRSQGGDHPPFEIPAFRDQRKEPQA